MPDEQQFRGAGRPPEPGLAVGGRAGMGLAARLCPAVRPLIPGTAAGGESGVGSGITTEG